MGVGVGCLNFKQTVSRESLGELKRQFQGRIMAFWYIRCCFMPNNGLRRDFTFLRSSVTELWFSTLRIQCINSVLWLAGACFDTLAILECVTELARKGVYDTLRHFQLLPPPSRQRIGMRHANTLRYRSQAYSTVHFSFVTSSAERVYKALRWRDVHGIVQFVNK